MDQTPQTPTTTTNGADFKITKVKNYPKKIIFIIALIVLVLIGLYFYSQKSKPLTQSQPWNTNPKFAPTKQLATVGSEPIYGSDLNFVLYTNYPNNKMTDQQAKKVALESAATSSAILQAAKTQNIASIPDSLFSPTANQTTKQQLVRDITDQVEAQSDVFSTSTISIWYYDMDPPKGSEATARQTARAKIAQLYNQIKSGTLTMQQAGDKIKADTTLSRLDANYQGNAYGENKDWTLDNMPFGFTELNDVALTLQTGQVSDIVEVISKKSLTEKFFTVIKMENRQKGKYTSLKSWIRDVTNQYPITTTP